MPWDLDDLPAEPPAKAPRAAGAAASATPLLGPSDKLESGANEKQEQGSRKRGAASSASSGGAGQQETSEAARAKGVLSRDVPKELRPIFKYLTLGVLSTLQDTRSLNGVVLDCVIVPTEPEDPGQWSCSKSFRRTETRRLEVVAAETPPSA